MGHDSEVQRLAVLQRLAILDSDPEAVFDAVTRLASQSFVSETAIVSLVDRDRQWFKSCVGLSGTETPRDIAFCDHTIRGDGVMVVLDAQLDPRFAENPLVTGPPYVRFYAGAPLTIDGERLGTLCLLDPCPRADFDAAQRAMLASMARIVEELMRQRIEVSERRGLMLDLEARSGQLLLAESLAGLGHWSVDLDAGTVTWSDEVFRIHGVTRSNFNPMLDDALQFFPDVDRAFVTKRLRDTWDGGTPFRLKGTLRRASDGALRRVLSKGELQRDSAGRPIQLFGVLQDITEQETLVARIRADQERYELLTRNATDVIAVCGPDFSFVYVSPSVESVFGYRAEALLGTSAEAIIHPDDRALVSAQLHALAEGGDRAATIIIVYRVCRPDRAWIWVEAHARIMLDRQGALDGFQYVARDITLRHEAETAARYRLLMENATDMVARVSLRGRILFITPACERILAYPPDAMLGQPALAFIHPHDRAHAKQQYRACVNLGRGAEPMIVQFRAVRRNGTVVWLEGRPRLIFDSDGSPVELQDAVRDVTAAKALEAELIAARQEADRAAQSKSDFLANMSHELRTPLNGILGFADVLSASPLLGAEDRRHARLIREAGSGLLAIVNDVLDLSRIEAGAVELQHEPVFLQELLTETLALVRGQAEKKGLDAVLDLPPEPVVVLADPERLRQIVLNLLGNAVKFTTAGSVSLGLRAEPKGEVLSLRISVRDTGIGIPPDRLQAMFGRYEQVDSTIARRFGGTGLGLSISRDLVDRMGGTIGVESTHGSGTCFTVTLDAQRAALLIRKASPRPGATPSAIAGMRVLLAEDVEMNQELFTLFLKPYGVDVDTVGNGLEALHAAERTHYDLILMDMQMPEMDGLESARRIRAGTGPSRDVPIIALTANVMSAEIEKCLQAGMNGHVGKPVDVGALVEALEEWAPAQAVQTALAG